MVYIKVTDFSDIVWIEEKTINKYWRQIMGHITNEVKAPIQVLIALNRDILEKKKIGEVIDNLIFEEE